MSGGRGYVVLYRNRRIKELRRNVLHPCLSNLRRIALLTQAEEAIRHVIKI